MSHWADFVFQIGLHILTASLSLAVQFFYNPGKLAVLLFSIPKLIVYFFIIIDFVQGIFQLKFELLGFQI